MTTEMDPLVAMVERAFSEAEEARHAAAELPAKLAGLRLMIRATLHVCPLEVGELADRYRDVVRLLQPTPDPSG